MSQTTRHKTVSCSRSRGVEQRPLIIAHRGFSGRAPENTLSSFTLAVQAGVDLVECDVHLSSDGVPVVIHDPTVDRTTDGTGEVARLSWAELSQLDAGDWFDQSYAGERVPALSAVLELIEGTSIGAAVEIKAAGGEQAIVEALRAAKIPAQRVLIFSFSREVLNTVHDLAPDLALLLLWEEPPPSAVDCSAWLEQLGGQGVTHLGVDEGICDEALVRRAHRSGLRVFVWTVDEPQRTRELLRWGVDGIITDHPNRGLRERSAGCS